MTEEQIFLAALDFPDRAKRTAYLDEACGQNRVLRGQIEELLDAHERSGEFLDKSAAEQIVAGTQPPRDQTVVLNAAGDNGNNSTDFKGDDHDGELSFLSPSTRTDSLGRLGHYEMLQVLGKGGFGIVFRAFDDTLQRVVAVKVMAPQIATTSPARKRFLREARSSAAVRHENVVHVYEVGEQPLPYLVMEFIPGETLQQKLDRNGPLEALEIVQIGRQVAEGLAAAHACDLIHRDIKPGNILLEGGTHKAKITDFGLARAADDASISQSGVIAGTPMFMSPEQALGHHIDQRADLFSLGSVLYQMASGRPPFRAPTALAVLKRVAEEMPRPIPEIIPETPDWLCGIIAKLHAKNPAERFQSAREVADVLADCEAKLKAKQEVKNVYAVAPVKPARRSWLPAVAAVLLLPIVVLGVTEFAGVTSLFRGHEPKNVGEDPAPIAGAKKDMPAEKKETPSPVENKLTRVPDKGAWTILKPIELKSEGGATLTQQDDASILVSGNLPDTDVYTLTFRDVPTKVRSLRLEVLPHASLPNDGPSRHSDMTFVLTKLKAEIEMPDKKGEPRDLTLVKAWADTSTGDDALPHFAIDQDDNTGWCAENGKRHFIVVELAAPVAVPEGAVLRVTLECKHDNAQRLLGCFRLSVTKDLVDANSILE